jgi:FMN phosphatase YigB (HAD superfamily)
VRYDAVFLDVDGTLLWIDLDVEGYVEAPEATFVVRDLGELPDLLRD